MARGELSEMQRPFTGFGRQAPMPPSVLTVVDAARSAGLLDGERAEHLSFRAPSALVEAAKRETGIQSTTELGIAALAALAQPDPVAAFFRRTNGRLAGLEPIEP